MWWFLIWWWQEALSALDWSNWRRIHGILCTEKIKEGEIVKGKVVNIEDYGAFLEIFPGVEGLVHVSEITWANTPINAKEFFKLGDEYESK